MRPNSLIATDRDHLIHSSVSWRDHEDRGVTMMASGDGVFLTDCEGNRLLDGFSGLWCVNLGYGQRRIVEAAAAQMATLPYATGYFHFGSEPAARLAGELAARSPGDLNHVFFTLGGSDAIDSAVRFIRYYFSITGHPAKQHMIALDRGYHGSSTTGSGLTGLAAFHTHFGSPLPTQHHIPTPYRYRSDEADDAQIVCESVMALRAKVETLGADRVAAFFAEPMIGSGGVIPPPDGWLRAMRDTCRELGILLVADEVITGFGRTGPMFGSEHDDVVPDLMTLAKGLTSGYLPMGAVLLSEAVYRGISDGTPRGQTIGHGLTYSGHPVSAAVALEVLRIYDEDAILQHAEGVSCRFARGLQRLADHPMVGDVRARGMLGAVELVCDKAGKTRFEPDLDLGGRAARAGYRNGLIFRAFPDGIIGLAPPLVCSDGEIDLLLERLERTLDELAGDPALSLALR